MAIIVGTNSYVSEAELTTYATDRGFTLTRSTSVTLTLAMDYLNTLTYSGYKTDADQALDFPRNGETETPQGIKNAQMEAALVFDAGEDPQGAVGPRVIENTVHGAVTQRFSDTGTSTKIYRKLNAALRPFLSNGGSGMQMVAIRG